MNESSDVLTRKASGMLLVEILTNQKGQSIYLDKIVSEFTPS